MLPKEVRAEQQKPMIFFAVQGMQIRGNKARSEGAYTRYVTELSNEVDKEGAPLNGKKHRKSECHRQGLGILFAK